MCMIKEEQFDEDNSLRPRMAVAGHGEVAAPDENGTNVKFAEKQVTTIAENDNSAGKNNQGDISGDPKVLVGGQDPLSTAAQARKAEADAGEKDEMSRVRKAEIKAGKEAAAAQTTAETVEQAATKQAAAIKKAARWAAEKKAAADKTIETARAQKAEIRTDEDAAAHAAKKTTEKVEQTAKKQAAAIEKADRETSKKAEKNAAAAKKAAEQAARKKAAADAKADAKTKKRSDADKAKAHTQSAAAEKKVADRKDAAAAKHWQTVVNMDEERTLGVRNTLSWCLTDSQDILFLLGTPFRHWKINWILSNKANAAAATTVAAKTMAMENVASIADEQATAIKKADQDARRSAGTKAQQSAIKAEDDGAAAEEAARVKRIRRQARDLEVQRLRYQIKKEAAAHTQAAEDMLTADEIRDKAVAAVDTMAAAIEKYATALAAANKTAGLPSYRGERELKGHRRAVRGTEIKAENAIDAAHRLGRAAEKHAVADERADAGARCPSLPPSTDWYKSRIQEFQTGADRFHGSDNSCFLDSLNTATKEYDTWLVQYIHHSVQPLQLTPRDLQAIHRRSGLYTECFPPDADGSNQFCVNAETLRHYCGLNFSEFPLHLVTDGNDTAAAITVAAAGTMAADAEQTAADEEANKLAQQKASVKRAEGKADAAVDKESAKLAQQTANVKCAEDAAAADAAVGAKAWATTESCRRRKGSRMPAAACHRQIRDQTNYGDMRRPRRPSNEPHV